MAVIALTNVIAGARKRPFRLASGTVVDGTSGTHAGEALAGELLIEASTGDLQANTNTQASPTWTVVGTQT
jgi:hypothetical protein